MSEQDTPRTIPNALPVGYRFNEFEIKEVIGGGGFGIVYRAWDHQLERTIAIKEFMPTSLAVRSDDLTLVLRSERFSKTFHAGLNSFIQEARLLARFNHPNLLHVLRFWVQNDTAYMGTAFYTGTTLSQLHLTRPEMISEAWIRCLLPPLFGAINTIHQEGYLHRDISLDNIQIQENGVPVLLDFGSARKAIGNLSDETETMLKPGFAPIEQYSDDNESEQGTWTDIYALGAVLHTLIVGSPPPVSVVRSIEDNYQPLAKLRPAGYSLPLLHAIDRALQLQPEDRPQTVDQLAALMELPPTDINASHEVNVSGPGTMLVPVEPEPAAATASTPPATPAKRFLMPGLIAAGVLVGIGVGAMIAGGSSDTQAQSASTAPAETTSSASGQPTATRSPPPAETASTNVAASDAATAQSNEPAKPSAPPPPAPIAQVYIRLQPGDRVAMNGSPQALVPAPNGFAMLQLAPGDYRFSISNDGHTRDQNITVDREGVWLLNPQG
ncbi:serine/threonine protein kinase [Erwinia psidii]|uniref:Serine/threonine protein kinase n=1 Tax=Erwinia psidii TaxID=69224 RepID=A0A3N6S762_9GAMM|nr:serine/threonine-protein kinase [Erwinia psidii]MCX8959392.1 serine/threonine protein kinase [Erwinia psidii]MCX8962648.1 serine/threonine protein kinase [Erwinia psidii]MCX8964244.1 serine/threonine protein kinase [Erwinia psidii]RQM36920.1 serine/threonine protein kinase [Erwinia psidii]